MFYENTHHRRRQRDCRTFKTALKREFFIIDQAYNGKDGLFLYRTNHYDLIILDYYLPEKLV